MINQAQATEFADKIKAIRDRAYADLGAADVKHLQKIELWGRLSTVFGLATAWIIPNLVSAFLLSMGLFTRWLLAHHIMHRGYDRIENLPAKYHSKNFARGKNRFVQWFDWILPEAWDHEHNVLHHFHTSEDEDPDLVERNTEFLRRTNFPRWLKYVFMFFVGITWKFTYYAPNTISCIGKNDQHLKSDQITYIYFKDILKLHEPLVRRLWLQSYLPYIGFHFIFIPGCFLVISQQAALFVLINKLIAEMITNMHSFLVVGPNHAGDDLFKYDFHYKGKAQFYLTQIMTSVNYSTGRQWEDYLQIYLNYQIEHHLIPDLPMLKYKEIQPEVKALCAEYKVPYLQQNVFLRFKKMLDICVGKTNQRPIDDYEGLSKSF